MSIDQHLDKGASPMVAERERVIALLSECFARGELDIDEFEERVTLTHRAENSEELHQVSADLSPPEIPPQVPALPLAKDARKTDSAVAILGGVRRAGAWPVPYHLRVLALGGGVELDFRDAQLPSGSVEVDITTFMGGVQIIVPPTLAAEVRGSAILGGFEELQRAPVHLDPNLPRLIVRGWAFLGGVSIETRLRGESSREAQLRRRKTRRIQRNGGTGHSP